MGEFLFKIAFPLAQPLYPIITFRPLKKPLLSTKTREVFLVFWAKNKPKYRKTGAEAVIETVSAPIFCFSGAK